MKRALLLFALLLCLQMVCTRASAQDSLRSERMDSVELSLLTCSPGQEVYSLYGHTAIRFRDLRDESQDWVFSYGMFSFKKKFFVLRFMFGLTDYDLGVLPIKAFLEEYSKRGSSVTEQMLNLSPEEKMALTNALFENAAPENRTYRYNYFYDNCTTRARNIIERCMGGQKQYPSEDVETATWRQLVHRYTAGHPWAQCGVDLLLGVKADMKTTAREQQFLPEMLMEDFAGATTTLYGQSKPLVSSTRMTVKPGVQLVEREFPLTPMECAAILLVVSTLIMIAELKRHRTYRAWDVVLMTLSGLAGVIIFLMFFSQHPTTSTNLQILLLNPLPLIFVWKPRRWWWQLWGVLLVAFLVGSIWQDYAEGTTLVALSLLTRVANHLKLDSTEKNKKG